MYVYTMRITDVNTFYIILMASLVAFFCFEHLDYVVFHSLLCQLLPAAYMYSVFADKG